MPPLRRLLLLLVLCAPPAFADALYRVELILFRHADPLFSSQRAPFDWARDAQPLERTAERATDLDELAARLDSGDGYRVLLHQAWQQRIGERRSLGAGQRQFEHFPIEGVIGLQQGRWLAVDVRLWVNRFGEYGQLLASEQLRQRVDLRPGELRYIDHGSLGLLIRASR